MREWARVPILASAVQLPKLAYFRLEFHFEALGRLCVCIPRLLCHCLVLECSRHRAVFELLLFSWLEHALLRGFAIFKCRALAWLFVHHLQVLCRNGRLMSVTEVIVPFLGFLFGREICHLFLITLLQCCSHVISALGISMVSWHWHLSGIKAMLFLSMVEVPSICFPLVVVCRGSSYRVLLVQWRHARLHHGWHFMGCWWRWHGHHELVELWRCRLCMHISTCLMSHSLDMLEWGLWVDVFTLLVV